MSDVLAIARSRIALALERVRPAYPRSAIERLPKWLNLVPMVAQWCWLGWRHRSLTLPSAANPCLTAGGLVGDGKAEYFAGMGPLARARVAPFVMVRPGGDDALGEALSAMHESALRFPVVAKPDLGWCGFGVCRLDNVPALAAYLARFPAGESLMLQRFLDEPGEAGIYYVRAPEQAHGRLLGVLLRHYPQVTGDGVSTLGELVCRDARLRRGLRDRHHAADFDPASVPAAGVSVRLSLIGSTRVGGRYEDASDSATPALLAAVDAIARDMPQFHVGRFDVRYGSLQELRNGHFTIMEINGAGAEAVHAWDPRHSLVEAYRIVFAKQRLLFALGAANRARGHRPVGMRALARHYLRQQRLISRYPPSN
ncbi:MAG: hypothetical protein ABI300_11765 [Rhodanobacter sp.]